MGMKRLFLVSLGLGFLSACGSGTSGPAPQLTTTYLFTSPRPTSGFYRFGTLPPEATANLVKIVQGEGGEAPEQQTLVAGDLQVQGYSGGNIEVRAWEADTCAEGYCALQGKPPLASSLLSHPGYFSLVVAHRGQHVVLNGTHTSNDKVKFSGQLDLGILGERTDGVALTLKPE